MPDALPFVCPICGLASWHPRDLAERFCAACGFVDDIQSKAGYDAARAKAAYHDDRCAERECDGCGKPYRGPALYCSLTCALADA